MKWYGRKFRNAPNELMMDSEVEVGEHLGEWCEGTFTYDVTRVSDLDRVVVSDYNPEATLVTSLLEPRLSPWGGPPSDREMHAPVLDLDIEHEYYPSSTPGHAALLLNVMLTPELHAKLLDVLAECGIVQSVWVDSNLIRGYAAVRTPWTKKPSPPELD